MGAGTGCRPEAVPGELLGKGRAECWLQPPTPQVWASYRLGTRAARRRPAGAQDTARPLLLPPGGQHPRRVKAWQGRRGERSGALLQFSILWPYLCTPWGANSGATTVMGASNFSNLIIFTSSHLSRIPVKWVHSLKAVLADSVGLQKDAVKC